MSFIQCPLCGRNVLEASFNPESFEDDVFGVQMQGLGKGKGFRVRERYSILEPSPTMDRMADRLLALLALFIRNDLISKSDLERSFFPNEANVLDTLRELLDSVNDVLTEDQTDEELVEWVDEYENQESTRKNELEDLVRELKTATEKLIEEYNASQATVDDLT